MADSHAARTVIGLIGNIISFCLFLSPIPTFVAIIKKEAVEDFKPDPYVATLLNCAMWSFYGMPFVKEDNILVLTINAIGFAIELVYVCIFFTYSPWKKRRKVLVALLIETLFMALVVLITMFCFHTPKRRAVFVGILCIVLNIVMYTSPLTVMKMVIRTKSVKYMPFFLSLASFSNGLIWLIYSLLEFDINLVLPSGLGTLSGFVQLVLYALYYRTTRWDDEDQIDGKGPNVPEVQLSSSV